MGMLRSLLHVELLGTRNPPEKCNHQSKTDSRRVMNGLLAMHRRDVRSEQCIKQLNVLFARVTGREGRSSHPSLSLLNS